MKAGRNNNGKAPKHMRQSVGKVLGMRLREWRLRKGFPLKFVARELGVSMSIVSEWEHAHRFPSVLNLEAIAILLDTHVCCLLYHGPGRCPHAKTA